jgi:DNA-binding CsgD family transcriptional regulator
MSGVTPLLSAVVQVSSVPAVQQRIAALNGQELGHRAYLAAVDDILRPALRYATGVWCTVDPANHLLTSCTLGGGEPMEPDRLEQLCRLEYTTVEPGNLFEIYRSQRTATSLRTEVDDPMTVRRYREITQPLGSHDELRLIFVLDGLCWGLLIAHRAESQGAFTSDEVEAAAQLSTTMANGLRMVFLRAAVAQPAGLDEPPGQLVVGRDREVRSTTATATRWLDSIGGEERLEFLLATLGPRVARGGHGSITVPTDRGPVSVHATAVTGVEGATALVLERPRPIVLTNLIISAYGFTPREREVAELVLRGLTTKQLARDLSISDYTVQDHLKAIFAKTGVASRGDLSWALYARFYLPPVSEDATPSPYGFYLDASD